MQHHGSRGIATLASGFLLVAAGTCRAQTDVLVEGFENGGTYSGWHVNGNQETFPGFGNPGNCIGVPLMDFWGITLSNDSAPELRGDLSRYSRLRVTFDVAVLALNNWFNEPIDPANFPIVLELIDQDGRGDRVSVYTVGRGMPAVSEGWTTVSFEIDTRSSTMPANWGGTGAEDPATLEPILPPGRTYGSVISSIDDFRVTTMRPGWFYAANFWQVLFDNVTIEEIGGVRCIADVDDGSGSGTPDGGVGIEDLLYYLSVYDQGLIEADVDNGTATGTPDGGVGIEDLLYYVSRYDAGC